MRTTLTLDDDNAARLERLRKERDASLKDIVNEVVRIGLDEIASPKARKKPFRTGVHRSGGLLPPYRNVKEVLEDMDDEYMAKKLRSS